jgi:hypothetical protein
MHMYADLIVSDSINEFMIGVDFLSRVKAVLKELQYRNIAYQWQLHTAKTTSVSSLHQVCFRA